MLELSIGPHTIGAIVKLYRVWNAIQCSEPPQRCNESCRGKIGYQCDMHRFSDKANKHTNETFLIYRLSLAALFVEDRPGKVHSSSRKWSCWHNSGWWQLPHELFGDIDSCSSTRCTWMNNIFNQSLQAITIVCVGEKRQYSSSFSLESQLMNLFHHQLSEVRLSGNNERVCNVWSKFCLLESTSHPE